MNFLDQLLKAIAFVPALVNGIEGLFGNKSGIEKKDAAMTFLQNALATIDAVAAREIVEPEKFRDGISKIIDNSVTNVGAGSFLPMAGGTMTGPITLPGSPAAPMQATTKQYVDRGIGFEVRLDCRTGSGK